MTPCEENKLGIFAYLDGELRGSDLELFESHLHGCEDCRAAVAEERRFLDQMHSLRPVYAVPPGLRSGVQRILNGEPARSGWYERFRAAISSLAPPVLQPGAARAAAASVLLAAILAGAWVTLNARRRYGSASEFATAAVGFHRQHLKGALPVELRSASAAEITAWLQTKLPFHVKLPAYPEIPGERQPYRYYGARVVSYQNRPAAYVAYETGGKPVSFMALPTSIAPPLRGRAVPMKSLTIFYSDLDGYHVITWSGPRSRLTYALVTDLEHPSRSCVICHAGPESKDRDLMRSLNQQ